MQKQYREKVVAMGMCPTCGARSPVPGKSACQKCLDRAKRNARNRRRTKPTETKKAVARWRKEHPTENKAIFTRHKNKLREIIFNHYGRTCACCGEGYEFLTLDHINNDGKQHRHTLKKQHHPAYHGGQTFYRWVIENNFPTDLQPLCFNCNWAKSVYGECPHKWKHG